MKVGTDGTLLGAWARGGRCVLDIGTGTGLIALMMAQRFPEAEVTAIDIAPEAYEQARRNVALSPFAERISVLLGDIRHVEFAKKFDAIVSNPPYFEDSMKNPDTQRKTARHTDTLSYGELFHAVNLLLTDTGEFSLVMPYDCLQRIEEEAVLHGFFLARKCAVKTTPRKAPRRYLLAFRKSPVAVEEDTGIVETAPNVRSEWYKNLTADFYL